MSDNQDRKDWKCYECKHTFLPNPPNFNCPQCGSTNTVPNYRILPKETTVTNSIPDEDILPGAPERVCHFQMRTTWKNVLGKDEDGLFSVKERVPIWECELTVRARGRALGEVIAVITESRAEYRSPCDPDMCPIYQTWKLQEELKK